MNETNVRNEILDSIDQVNAVTMESTMDVFNSLAASYDKAGMILEYSTSDDLDMFAIFQEAEAKEGDVSTDANAKKGGKQESLGMKILMFIPNILKKIWQFLKDAWNGIITPKAPAAKENKSLFEKILGKDAEWINNHKVELGLSGAALASVIAFVTFMKKDAIANALSRWFGNIKKFFLAVKVAPKLAWNGKSFVTNIKLEGFVSTLKKLIEAVKAAQDAIKFIEDNAPNKKFSNIKDSLANWIKNVEEIKKAAESDPFILGEDVDLTGATLVDILNKMKDLFTKGLPATAYDVNVEKLKALFENTEDSYVKEILGQLNNMKTALSLIGGIVMSSSELMKDTNTYATMVFDVQNKTDGSAPAEGEAKEEEKSEGEAKEEENAEESTEESAEESAESGGAIENKEVEAAVEKAEENPSPETVAAAIDKVETMANEIKAGDDGKKLQVVQQVKATAQQASKAVKSGKTKADKKAAKKVRKLAKKVEKAVKIVNKADVTPDELNKAKAEIISASRQVSAATTKQAPPEEYKKNDQYKTAYDGGKYVFKTSGELMAFLNDMLGANNFVQSANVENKQGIIKVLTKKGKVAKITGETKADARLKAAVGNISKGIIRYNDGTWIVESFEDELDEAIVTVEHAFIDYLGIDDPVVVEYADGTIEEASEVVLESYDETAAEAEVINNHWYR